MKELDWNIKNIIGKLNIELMKIRWWIEDFLNGRI